MEPLTHNTIKNLRVDKRRELADESDRHGKRRKGLMLQANVSGNHRFLYNRLIRGTRYRFTLGAFPDLSLAAAREMVDAINDYDGTPQEAWDALYKPKEEGKEEGVLTVQQFINQYMDKQCSLFNRDWEEQQRILVRELGPYKDLPATDLTADHVADVAQRCLDRGSPSMAHEIVKQTRTMYNWGMGIKRDRDIVLQKEDVTHIKVRKDILGIEVNPTQGITIPKYKPKQHSFQGAELSALSEKLLASEVREDVKAILMVQLQTFCRVGEVAGMSWTELDLRKREWVIPGERYKTGEPHTVLFSTQTADLLKQIKKTSKSDYVFPMPRFPDKPLRSSEVAHRINYARASLDMDKDFSSHTLRRSGSTWLASKACPYEVKERLLGHKIDVVGDMSNRYNKHTYMDERREWTQKWCDFLEGKK